MAKKNIAISLILSFFILIWPFRMVHAASVSIVGKAKVLNTNSSYLDFTSYNSNVTVNDSTGIFSGYAFLEDMGWVAFGTADNAQGPVSLNLTTGAVTGKAKVLNSGIYLDFTNYSSNVSSTIPGGVFSGYVFSEDIGWINFSDTGVSTSTPLDNTAPVISLTAAASDLSSDNTPTILGTATDSSSTVSSVQFQADSTSGSWTACTADDGTFDESSESFTCTASSLDDGAHTIYIRATDSNNNTTGSGSESSDSFTVDTTSPNEFNLESPGDKSYTESERLTFRWKAASTLDATSSLSKYKLEIDNGDSGDFSIDDIPVSGTADVVANRYSIHFENFGDSDGSNNYISVYTKSSSDWRSEQNDGKTKEGKRNFTVTAYDTAGNTRAHSRTFYLDRSGPSLSLQEINDMAFLFSENVIYSTPDRTPKIKGSLTDNLTGDKTDNKVASGPKSLSLVLDKKNILGSYESYKTVQVAINKTYWTDNGTEVTDNTSNRSDKFADFYYTFTDNLDYGTYKVKIKGKDAANNESADKTFYLKISESIKDSVGTSEYKTAEEEVLKDFPEKSSEEIEKEIEMKLEEKVIEETIREPNIFEKISASLMPIPGKIYWGTINFIKTDINALVSGYNYVISFGTRITKSLPIASVNLRNFGTGIKNSTESISDTVNSISSPLVKKMTGFTQSQQLKLAATFEIWFDSNPVIISDVQASEIGKDYVVVTWKTNHYSTSKVNYGSTYDYGKDVQSNELTKNHKIRIDGLSPDTSYYYEVMSKGKTYAYDARHEVTTLPE